MRLSPSSTTEPETIHGEYQMDPGLRRSCWYVLASIPVLVAVGAFVGTVLERPNREGAAAMMIALAGGFILWMVVALSWRLRIDNIGISRRLLWFWSLWTWDDFASGRIQKKSSGEFYDPERRRSLQIGYLPQDVLRSVFDRINESYVAPPAPPILEGLQFGKRFPFQPRGQMDATGIEVETKNGPIRVRWSDVIRLRFVRTDPLARHYRTATLEVPGSTITWVKAMSPLTQSLDGKLCTEEEISDFLLARVPLEKVVVDRHGVRPHCREDIIEQLQRLDASSKQKDRVLISCGLAACAFVGFLLYEKGLVRGLLTGVSMSALYLFFCGPIIWFAKREEFRFRTRLSNWLAEFDNSKVVQAPYASGVETPGNRAEP